MELCPGVLAGSNAELVERAVRIGELAGRTVPDPRRELLGPAA